MMDILAIEGLIAGYKTANVLQGVSISLREGEIVSVVGRNGVGKTTLVRAVIGLLAARGGHVRFAGEDITSYSADRRARLGVGYVPQGRGIFPQLTVLSIAPLIARHRDLLGTLTRRELIAFAEGLQPVQAGE